MTDSSMLRPQQNRPFHGYLLCGSPRSGSTMLCDLLTRTGVAGNPESYFQSQSIGAYSNELGLSSDAQHWGQEYVDRVRCAAMSSNGCVGIRIMWTNMAQVLRVLAHLYPKANDDSGRLQTAFGMQRYVFLYREDKIAQAVSLVLALQTGLWHLNADGTVREGDLETREPRFDSEAIARELKMLEREEEGWQTWFASQAIEPLRMSYESLASDPEAGLQLVLDRIGQRPKGSLPGVRTAPTSSNINDEWAAKFRRGQPE